MREVMADIPSTVVADFGLAYDIAHSVDADRGTSYSAMSFEYSQYKKIAGAALRLTLSSPRPVPTKTDEFWNLYMQIPSPNGFGRAEMNDEQVRPFVDEVFNDIPGVTSQSFKGQAPMISVPDVCEVAIRASERALGLKIKLALLEFAATEKYELDLAKKRKTTAVNTVLDLV